MNLSYFFFELKKHLTTLLFIFGFFFDLIILPEAGHKATIFIGGVYLLIIALSLAFRELVISSNRASKKEAQIFSFLTFFIAYFSGSALSFISVYAIRGAAFSVSWPLIILLILSAVVNEIVSSHHFRLTLDVGVLFFATLFFFIFNVPVFLKEQNDFTFVISVIVTIFLSLFFVFVLQFTSESAKEESAKLYALSLGIPMFIGMFYFLNVIPAVPLSLKDAGVYHMITKDTSNNFVGEKEVDDRFFSSVRMPVYHKKIDEEIYFFSSVKAPALLDAPIYHIWEYYNDTENRWEEKTKISFSLSGGREEGYRAYSKKENTIDGLWRVTVKVDDKRIVGRMKFYIITDEKEKEFVNIKM